MSSTMQVDAGILVEHARANERKWGVQDFETLGLAVAEESGELAQAILQAKFEGKSPEYIYQEAKDLGALCLQIMRQF